MWPSTPCACPAPTDQGAQHRDEPAAALLASWQRNLVVRVGVDRRRRPVSRPGGSVTSEQVQFQEFFAAHYPRLRRLGYWLTGSWVEAEDLAQEAMVRTFWRWPSVRRHDRPEDYARKVLVNRHRSLLRRALVRTRHAAQTDHAAPVVVSDPTDALVLW